MLKKVVHIILGVELARKCLFYYILFYLFGRNDFLFLNLFIYFFNFILFLFFKFNLILFLNFT